MIPQSYIGYTYLITFLPTGQVYYGSRCAKNCNPSEFWVKYFTSSKLIKEMIQKHGKDSFSYEIRKTFIEDPKKAQDWERRVLKRINAGKKQQFLNRSDGVAPCLSGWKNPFFGKKHTEETRKKMKERQSNKQGEKNPNWKGGLDRRKFKGDENLRQLTHSKRMTNVNPMYNENVKNKHQESMNKRPTYKCQHCDKLLNLGAYSVHQKALAKKGINIPNISSVR